MDHKEIQKLEQNMENIEKGTRENMLQACSCHTNDLYVVCDESVVNFTYQDTNCIVDNSAAIHVYFQGMSFPRNIH